MTTSHSSPDRPVPAPTDHQHNIALFAFSLGGAGNPACRLFATFISHLQGLWRGLASLPAVFPGRRRSLIDKAYPWLLNGLVRKRFKKKNLPTARAPDGEYVPHHPVGWGVVPFTLLAFWIRYLPRHDGGSDAASHFPDRACRRVWAVLVPARRGPVRGATGTGDKGDRPPLGRPKVAYSPRPFERDVGDVRLCIDCSGGSLVLRPEPSGDNLLAKPFQPSMNLIAAGIQSR